MVTYLYCTFPSTFDDFPGSGSSRPTTRPVLHRSLRFLPATRHRRSPGHAQSRARSSIRVRARSSPVSSRSSSSAATPRRPRAKRRHGSPIPLPSPSSPASRPDCSAARSTRSTKPLTAIKLAAKISREHSVPAVAVFWVEAEDHDWDEVSSCAVLDAEFQRQVVTLPAPAGAGHLPDRSCSTRRRHSDGDRPSGGHAAADRVHGRAPRRSRTAYRPGVTMSDAFARWMERLLGELGLVVFDCADPSAKPLASRVFAHEMTHPGTTWQLASEAGEQLAAGGYHAQVDADAHDTSALFRLTTPARPSRWPTRRASVEAARTVPETFSPNVLLRPIVEDALFPTVCYVSGPNELAYLAQLRGVYEHFGVPMPLVYPRASATVLDSASAPAFCPSTICRSRRCRRRTSRRSTACWPQHCRRRWIGRSATPR